MIFNTDYWNSLNKKERETVKLNPSQLGYSLGGDPLKNLKAGIFMGTNDMELTFFNSPGKSQQKGSPEAWTKTERQEMKELARVNEVDVTIHATPNMGGGGGSFSGFTGQNFSDEARQKAIDEMSRTSEFAADVAGGGPVVFHIDGFQRPVYDAGVKEGAKEGEFESYKEEKQKAPLFFVDKKTGRIQQISREDSVFLPVPVLDDKGKRTGEYELDDDERYYKVEAKTIDDMEDEFKKLTDKDQKKYKNHFNFFFSEIKKPQSEESYARREEYMDSTKRLGKREKEYGKMLKEFQEAKDGKASQSMIHDILKQGQAESARRGEAISLEEMKDMNENPEKFLKEKVEYYKQQKKIFETGVIGYTRQIEKEEEDIAAYEEISNYGVDKEADTIAQAAMNAFEIEKKKKLKKPLYVAPENWAVEMYGSHPKEYRKVISKSRDRMQEYLQRQNTSLSNHQAAKIAEEHIKGTFDIGHLNMWKKYYKAKPGEDKDKGFAKWMDKNVRGLVKDKIIGHVHLSDNFGYHDEHIEIGEGNTPIQEFFKILKEEDYKGKMIAEPGGQREKQLHRAWSSALMAGRSPIYRVDGTSKTWTDVAGSYFGRTQSPSFIVGSYAPSKDDWTLWSEVPLE
ncbi:sugar phosphate isomerase/epimerase [Candidatus Woesearchaeota archaeon]|jgi:hypothetical protein|nr:sugar phosphate isomerase/epimerase [Candidatus Woesearchaeota archaeon]MBT6044790.1 sugar phosphate isomerase/epimerase [Candidatus Woesearchaeota archaeon]